MNSPKRLARIAGVLYLAVGIFGAFAEDFVDLKPRHGWFTNPGSEDDR